VREWTRMRIDRRCGCCGRTIATGQPILVIGRFKKLRCSDCSTHDGEPPPADLPELQPLPKTEPMSKFAMTPLGAMARDWKTQQSGDDAA